MKKNVSNIALAILFLAFIGCKENKKKESEPAVDTKIENDSAPSPITIEKLNGSPEYAVAVLQMNSPKSSKIAQGGEIDFEFNVNNYELGAQTTGPNAELLANSSKGQHIHFILDNQPYSAHYEANFNKEIPNGAHHLVAFLSRSYHESVKNENSVVVHKLEVGENPHDSIGIDINAPTLIYSRPKGTYSGKDTENLLLDFFVLNTTLSENGNKVKATVNGKEFIISEWAPQVIKGLPKGEVTIKLQLIDKDGNQIPGPFNEVTRKVSLNE